MARVGRLEQEKRRADVNLGGGCIIKVNNYEQLQLVWEPSQKSYIMQQKVSAKNEHTKMYLT